MCRPSPTNKRAGFVIDDKLCQFEQNSYIFVSPFPFTEETDLFFIYVKVIFALTSLSSFCPTIDDKIVMPKFLCCARGSTIV